MKALLLIGGRGKTVLAYGILKKCIDNGLKASYMKIPVKGVIEVEGRKVDYDVYAIKEALGLKDPIEAMAPITYEFDTIELMGRRNELKGMVKHALELIRDRDFVLIEGPRRPESLLNVFPIPEIASLFSAKVIYIVDLKEYEALGEALDAITLCKALFERFSWRLDGVIFNEVPAYLESKVKGDIVKILDEMGVKAYGAIGEFKRLFAPTARDIAEYLKAEVLEEGRGLDVLIEEVLVGAMTPGSAIHWFRRASNAAIVTGGDRTDLILTALETRPSVVVLTGGIRPEPIVISRARDVGVPLLLVPYDTFTTAVRIREAYGIVTPHSLKAKEADIVRIIESLSLNGLIPQTS